VQKLAISAALASLAALLTLQAASAAPSSRAGLQLPTRGVINQRAKPNMLVFSSYNFPLDASTGAYPTGSLIDVNNMLFGTTNVGGSSGNGTVFTIARNLTPGSVSALHNFGSVPGDLTWPSSALLQKGAWLWGTAPLGGSVGAGGVFKVKPGQPTTYSFGDFANGPGQPSGPLVDAVSNLWGVTGSGGIGYGNVYHLTTPNNASACANFNSIDGENPGGALVKDGQYLYGVGAYGGAHGTGVIFRINTLNCAAGITYYSFGTYTASPDGATPNGGLVKVGNKLYGTTSAGGSFGYGTIFQVTATSTTISEQPIYSFQPGGTNGTSPAASVIASGNVLYGTTQGGGGSSACTLNGNPGCGTMYQFTLPAGPYQTMHPFVGTDGAWPEASIYLDPNGGFFGTTRLGGTFNSGTVFSMTCPSCQ
jgi:uncharacterized repeat protein (TIGR03803 family)